MSEIRATITTGIAMNSALEATNLTLGRARPLHTAPLIQELKAPTRHQQLKRRNGRDHTAHKPLSSEEPSQPLRKVIGR